MRPALALPALLLLAACSTPTSTEAAGPAPAPPAPVSDAVFGDYSTVDWCSLIDPGVLSALGTPTQAKPEGYDGCYAGIADPRAGFSPMTLHLGAQDPLSPESFAVDTQRADDGATVITQVDIESECRKLLTLPSGSRVAVRLEVLGDPVTTGTPCTPVDAQLKSLRTSLNSGRPVAHHQVSAPTARTADPCAAAPADVVAGTPGLAGTARRRLPVSHHCVWEQGNDLRLSVSLSSEGRGAGEFREHKTIEGQAVTLSRFSDGACWLVLPVRPVAGDTEGAVETVRVRYTPPSRDVDSCGLAAKIAIGARTTLTA
ncbi:hypothetical protein [Actinokineospora sp. NBRC 105648]|uniref:hypothetical protein n=1 Tax=Actinokineospora sp. NBRC 105648 TaxID=3032206 RepID=UPI0024A2995C|nr:hypothetical protein [Actinokineospora sp. NBRC 105648]GLZ37090.1 hypothetical protein Acsp05_07150 [Actinokineospora sp. NBRC 105648]